MKERTTVNNSASQTAWCLLGIPFHDVTVEGACRFIEQCVQKKCKAVLSTPNVNWVVTAHKDKFFHEQSLVGDLNIIDGMPLFWCARFLGIPLPEKVSGSDIAEELWNNSTEKRKTVYFFGGEENVAQEANREANASSPGLKGVGFCNPGYGTIDELSRDKYIQNINRVAPDMVFVALGAKKGVAWIYRNRDRINASILTHLGAVLNFITKKVKRAPWWMQRSGVEWIWRILQEPKLWVRYLRDGTVFSGLFLTKVLPLKWLILWHRAEEEETAFPALRIEKGPERTLVVVDGVCNRNHREQIQKIFEEATSENFDVVVDLEKALYVDSSFFGNLLDLWRRQHLCGRNTGVVRAGAKIKKLFELFMVDRLFMPGQGLGGGKRRRV